MDWRRITCRIFLHDPVNKGRTYFFKKLSMSRFKFAEFPVHFRAWVTAWIYGWIGRVLANKTRKFIGIHHY